MKSGIYTVINTLVPLETARGPECPASLAAVRHRCYVGKAKDIEHRWLKAHVPFLLNGRHACSYLLDAFHDWLRSDPDLLALLNRSPAQFKAKWLVQREDGAQPAWDLGPFQFRVLETVPEELLTAREDVYHGANVNGYVGSDPAKRYRRWQTWDGKLD